MKNLLITGGSQGIGKATALEAAKKGMFIGINYNSVILKCDVSKNSAVKDMFENFVNNAGSLDGVFNNAGTTGPVSKIHELDPKDFKSLIDTNVIGAFNVAQESYGKYCKYDFYCCRHWWSWRIGSLCNVKRCY